MDVTVANGDLKKALAVVKPAVSRRNNGLAILSGVRLAASDGRLTVQGTDLDVLAEVTVDAEVAEAGVVIVAPAQLADLVKKKGSLRISDDGEGKARLSGIGEMSVQTLPVDEWPRRIVSPAPQATWFPLPLDGLASVLPAASKDDTRPILTGVLFGGPHVVATDSYRLHVHDLGEDPGWPTVIVPARTLAMVVKHAHGAASIAFGEPTDLPGADPRIATIRSGNVEWTVRLIDGTFPNYQQLIPSGYPNWVTVDRVALRDAVAGALPMCRDCTPVRFDIGHGDNDEWAAETGHIRVHATQQDVGTFERNVETFARTGLGLVAFNPQFFDACLAAGTGDTVTFSWLDGLKPAKIIDDSATMRIIMPVRVS